MLKTPLSNVIFYGHTFFLLTTPISVTQENQLAIFQKQEIKIEVSTSKKDIPFRAANIDHITPIAKSRSSQNKLPIFEAFNTPQVPLNKQSARFVKSYIRKNKKCLAKIKKRSDAPFKVMDKVFKKYSLPVELKYLAVVESELKSSALSRVGAVGPWQLMSATAKSLGLKVTSGNDERTSYYKSTVAAAKYLKVLHRQFGGDWLLVLAAYNSGPTKVLRAINQAGSRNFWAIQDYLPAETRGHVKRFIATHYYFEGQGGITTLTKTEHLEYTKSMNSFAASLSSSFTPEINP